jgi:hypothetical protein
MEIRTLKTGGCGTGQIFHRTGVSELAGGLMCQADRSKPLLTGKEVEITVNA